MEREIYNFDFNHIEGNQSAIQRLQNAIKSKQTPHAFIFNGEKGMGKKLLAATVAKTLQCEKKGCEPCGICQSCQVFDSYNHPDIFWVQSDKKSIGVNDIREQIIAPMEIKPYQSPKKIFIVDRAEAMTIEAQNALLKTIEEPAHFGVFMFLTTHIKQFLPTIISRCTIINMEPVSKDTLIKHIMKAASLSLPQAEGLELFSSGNIGKAMYLLSDNSFSDLKTMLETHLIQIIEKKDLAHALGMSTILEPYKNKMEDVFDILIYYFRNIYLNSLFDTNNQIANIEAIMKAKYALRYHGNFTMVMDHLFVSFLHIL